MLTGTGCTLEDTLIYRWTGYAFLILSPYRYMIHASGVKASAINASSEFPHPCPSAPYMLGPANGKNAPSNDRVIVLAAAALAA